MKPFHQKRLSLLAALCAGALGMPPAQAQTAAFTGAYTQNFDALGASGAALPPGFTAMAIAGGNSDYTAANPLSASAVASAVADTQSLLIWNAGDAVNRSGTQSFNVGCWDGLTDRALGTDPTGTAAQVIQLTLTNSTGGTLYGVTFSYDCKCLTNGSAGDESSELPGYAFFYSTTGGATAADWAEVGYAGTTNDAGGIPAAHGLCLPNYTQGTTLSSGPVNITFATPLPANGVMSFRWADDNNIASSPDQMLAIDNISVATYTPAGVLASISSPANNATLVAGASLTIAANASETGGTITNVEFYANTADLGGVTSAPYTLNWPNVPAGNYALTVVASDASGLMATSTVVNVSAAVPKPVVSITTPASNANFALNTNVTITASATETGGTITNVEFYAGTTDLGGASSAPYSLTWSNVAAGSYPLTAVASDAGGLMTTSSVVNILVGYSLPTVSFVTPTNNQVITPLTFLPIAVQAASADSTVISVAYYVNGSKVYTSTTAPFSFAAPSGFPAGKYTLTAVATDALGLVASPSSVSITVDTAPVVSLVAPTNTQNYIPRASITASANAASTYSTISSVTFYLDGVYAIPGTLSAPGTYSYTLPGSTLPVGNWTLDAVATDALGLKTTSATIAFSVHHTPPAISLDSPASGNAYSAPSSITLATTPADADGVVTNVAFYQGSTLLANVTNAPFNYTWPNVFAGSYNLTAVASDSDGLTASSSVVSITVTNPTGIPVVGITSPTNNAGFTPGSSIVLTANALEAGGAITNVEFYAGTTDLGGAASAPYSLSWAGAPAGSYALTAVASDAQGLMSTSPVVNITVSTPHVPPTVSLTSPTNNASFNVSAGITLTATAADVDGTVTNVAFYQATTLLANVTSAPYTFTWTNVHSGSYTLTAVATDDSGASTVSASAFVTVTDPVALATLRQIKTVFVIALENHDLVQQNPTGGNAQQLLGNPACPYFNSLITPGNSNAVQTAYATHYYNVAQGEHPSEPNYIWSEAGTEFGTHTDNDPTTGTGNIFTNIVHLSGQLTAAGIAWKSYQEDLEYSPSAAVSANGSGAPVNPYNGTTEYDYAVKHNPMEFFTDTQNKNCYPLTNFWTDLANNNVGRYNWITPDEYNEMHSSLPAGYTYNGTAYTGDQAAIAEGDNCLSIIVPKIMASQAFKDHGVIIIWTDETESTDDANTTLPYVIISPLAKGNAYASTLPYSHSSDLKTMDELFGLAYQTNAIPAASYNAADTGTGFFNYVDGRSSVINDLSDFFVPANASVPAPALAVQQAGATLTNGASAAFAAVNIGANLSSTFTVTNPGSASLVLSNIAATGVDAGDFTVSGLTLPATVLAGGSATFSVVFAPLGAGTRSATLQITDNDTNNSPFTLALSGTGVLVPPTVSLTGPANGASFAAPANLALTATAADIDGTVTNVAFYQGTTLLGNATSAPFTFTTANIFAGSYALTAVATDNNGLTATSSVVNVTITNTAALSVLQSIKTVFIIAMENHDLVQKNPTGSPQQILGNPAAPYFNSLITPGNPNAAQTAWATHMFSCAINGEHPSEPNYIWMEAGTDFGVRSDNDPNASTSVHNVFTNVMHLSGQLNAAGIPWKTYQEDVEYSASEEASTSGSGKPVNVYNGTTQYNYGVKHNPMAFFPDTQNQNCYPMTNFWTDLTNHNIGRYNWITPDQYNEWHSALSGGYAYYGTNYTGDQAAIASGDNALSIIIPKIMASAAYQDHGVIIIWTDETESTDDTNSTLPYVIISPLAKGNAYASTLPYSHSSDLKTMDEIFGLAYQTNAIPAAYYDAQNDGKYDYVDGHSAPINDLSDFFKGVGADAPALTVLQNGGSLTNGASAAAFGAVSFFSAATGTFSITNTGNATLVVSNVVATGAEAEDFTVTGLTQPAILAAGQGTSFNVVFSPLDSGTRVATLQILDNDPNNNPFTLALTGTGVDEPPTVVLTAPANGAKFAAPANLTLSAGASDLYGAITNVAFYQGTNLLGNVAGTPFSLKTANLFAGSYALTAVATDDSGAVATSSVVNVTITNTAALSVLQSIKTVFIIAMENHDLVQKNPTGSPQQMLGNPAAPYFNSLITPGNSNAVQTAWATHMFSCAINGEHPSEPNYIWAEAGTDFGVRSDNDPNASPSVHNVFTNVMHLSAQLTAAGIPWRSYQEDLEYTTSEEKSASGSTTIVNPYNGTKQYNYGVKHNPMAFFNDTQNKYCYPMTNFWTDLTNGNIGRYNWITPDQYNEWHSALSGTYTYNGTAWTGDQSAIASGDNALSIIIPKLMASAAYQDHGMIIIWTDETESTDDTNTTLPYVIISPLAKGNAYASMLPYNHSSDLKTMDEIFGLAYQTNAIPAAYLDAQNDGLYDYVDGHSAPINDLSDFFRGVGMMITNQPASVTTNAGTTAGFNIGATAPTPLNYQWYFGTNLLTGQTNSALSLASVGPTNVGSYYVVVSTASGSANSAPASLTVIYQAPNVVGGQVKLGASGFQLAFSGPSGQTYKVLASDDLTVPQSAWTVVGSGTFGSTGVSFTDPDAVNHPHRYYVITSP